MLFIDFSSAFNTAIPSRLVTKLHDLGISPSLCNWTLDFLTNRPHSVRLGNFTTSTLILNTGVPQGCVLSPFLYYSFTYDVSSCTQYQHHRWFTDDTTVVGLIGDSDESAYREEVKHLAAWCADNNLALNTKKTKELIVDYRKSKSCSHATVLIDALKWSVCPASNSWVSTSLMTSPGPSTPQPWSKRCSSACTF